MSRNLRWETLNCEQFEELCCQLARSYVSSQEGVFYRVEGKGGDEGVEALFVLPDGTEWGWQAKFFPGRLNPSRWKQIRNSIDRALECHPNLRRYYVCLPINLTPSEIRKWEELKNEYRNRIQSELEFELWSASVLEDLLTRSENIGKYDFFFGELKLDKQWFQKKIEEARASLGERYTPDARVDLPELFYYFEVLGRTHQFRKDLLEWSDKINHHHRNLEGYHDVVAANNQFEPYKRITNGLDKISNLLRWSAENSDPHYRLPVEELTREARETNQITWEVWRELSASRTEKTLREKGYEHYLWETAILLGNFVDTVENQKWNLANEVGLALYGEAGVGKSHCLFDIALSRQEQGLLSIFVLGHQFPTNSQPIADLATLLGLGSQPEEVILGALSSAAESTGAPLILFFDALNESGNLNYWRSHLPALVEKLHHYPWLRVVVSYRTIYRQELMGECQLIPEVEHPGFARHEIEALRRLCEFYKVEFPSLPVLSPEFHNPLFLHLVFRALRDAGETVWPRGLRGFRQAYELFVSSCNKRVSRRLDCDPEARWVHKAIRALASKMVGYGRNWITVEEAKQIIDEVYPERSTRRNYSRSFFRALIDEHVITLDRIWNPDSGELMNAIRFTFQRFADHAIVEQLLTLLGDNPKDEDFQAAFGAGGVIDLRSLGFSIIEALAIQLPERFNKELTDFVDWNDEYIRYIVQQAILHSFIWRDPKAFPSPERLCAYINERLGGLTDEVFSVLLTVCARPEHPLNAEFLHYNLINLPMAERDACWTLYLHRNFGDSGSPIQRILDWGSNADFNRVDQQCVELFATTVCWLFTSSNRELRDLATKVLARIFHQRLECAKAILERFREVDDLYVKERLYGAVYGACLWHNREQRELLTDLARWFYDREFKNESPLLHLLARDYARGVIEVAAKVNALPDGLELEKVRPPYRSPWPLEDVPQFPDVEQFERGSGLLAIIASLRFGDFARYIVASDVNKFILDDRNNQINADYILRWIYARILQFGYKDDLFSEYDGMLSRYNFDRTNHRRERIGKKYQWITFNECIARIADNCLFRPDSWSSENTIYNGPWELWRRDIDPSCWFEGKTPTLKSPWWVSALEPLLPEKIFQEHKYIEWVQKDDTRAYSEWIRRTLLVFSPDGQKWIVAYANYSWRDEKKAEKTEIPNSWLELWFQVRGYLVKKPTAVLKWSRSQDFWEHWMPEWDGLDVYQAFLGEYSWHPSWKESCERADWQKPQRIQNHCRHLFRVPYVTYLWENGYDYSREGRVHMLLPAPWLVEEGGLQLDRQHLVWRDETGRIVAWDPAGLSSDQPHVLLLNADWLKEFLRRTRTGFFWAVAGEKLYVRDLSSIGSSATNRLSGGFLWIGSDIKGNLQSVEVKVFDEES